MHSIHFNNRLRVLRWLPVLLLALFLSASSYATGPRSRATEQADVTVTGLITDERGEGLPGVSVAVKGSTRGTSSDNTGRYQLAVPGPEAVLVFSYIGYARQELTVGNRQSLNVTLVADEQNLNEVVVVGYGTQRKSDVTGSLSSVTAKEIRAVPVTGVGQALQGRAAGVFVTQGSNAPGGGVTVRVRGGNSINAGNEPLYVIDGFPVYNENGPNLNPNDIESMEILKDASATAIYGSRGANGVVIITTKRGRAGQGRVEFDTYQGIQQVRRQIPMLNATEYAQLVNEAQVNAGRGPLFTNEQVAGFGAGTNWQDEIFRSAPMRNYQLTASGGTDKTRYAISGNYFKQDGVILNSSFDRGSLRFNFDHKLNDKFSLGTNLNIVRSRQFAVPTDADGGNSASVVYGALNFSPTQPVYNPDGTLVVFNTPGRIQIGSPVAQALGTSNRTVGTRLIGNVFVDYRILPGLTFRTSFGSDINYSKNSFYISRLTASGAQLGGQGAIQNDQSTNWLNENTLTYNRTINKVHNLTLLGGYTMQGNRFERVRAVAQGFANDILTFDNLGGASTPLIPTSSASLWQLNSYIGRVNYDYSGKYLVTATVRADGSSRFGAGNKWAVFPSGSVAWRISEEAFLKNNSVLNDLKLRLSYGLSGNQEIGEYQSLATLGTQNANFNNTVAIGVGPSRVANPDLRWETTAQTNIGIDVGLWSNRLTLTADVYEKKTTDLLLSVPLPFTSGYASALQNLGSIRNRGVELGINSTNTTGIFKWTTSFNIAANRNRVLNLGTQQEFPSGESSGHLQLPNSGLVRVGEQIGLFYGLKSNGIFQNQTELDASAQKTAKPGDIRYVDQDGNGVINQSDRVILGYAQPKFYGGLTNTFAYRGVELSVFMQGTSGNSIFNINRFEQESLTGVSNQSRVVLDRWTPTNPSNTVPRANAVGNAYVISDRQIEDGSYLRVKNINLSYTLPQALTRKIKINNVKVYVSAQNLLTFTNYTGFDPEVNRFGQNTLSQGTDYGSYPGSRIFLGGLVLGL
ncbi:SusC/RagA family TonB-linked outer membrane protein [Spirosoma utsteinense]|uniref:TonB-linked SusC/RagA family outer membrane protein n=1 Tax=Spirosoma utsteinense TaxID=2585773 RepID=A0ABR6W389_9BACT|nr:TonB-dependent receptor [Spirosoma utsteinense]MBC3786713.1 TonB-linked SusC/RagA family outer membrane protein [Spirosoma utsteinense]MBC3791076.1 TonB-linked SusC/RagA family outer membrane protein [Spirosoma utsteinense]